MALIWKRAWLAGLVLGVVLGLIIGGLWPDTPLHAVATDRHEGFIIATGWVDEGVEAVYFLDSLTGALRAKVVSNRSAAFQAFYEANVYRDLAAAVGNLNLRVQATNRGAPAGTPPVPDVQLPQTPNYIMVTGQVDIRRGSAARMTPAAAAVYVAETNTGVVLAYILPWDRHSHQADQIGGGVLNLWATDLFTTPLVQTP